MGMVVRSNIMAVNANRQLGMNNSQVSKSLEKLSSGFKINRAGDDASGLAISEKMKAQIKGLETASANSQDGVSLIQTAEGALTEVHDMLNRMVELSGKAANGTMDTNVDRASIQKEVVALRDEIDRIADSTNFNGIKLLDGTLGGYAPTTDTAAVDGVIAKNPVTVTGGRLNGADSVAVKHATADGAVTLGSVTIGGVTMADADALAAKGLSVETTSPDGTKNGVYTFTLKVTDKTKATADIADAIGSGVTISVSTLGKPAAADATYTLTVKGDAGKPGEGGGLRLQVGDTSESFNQVTVSVGNMGTKGLAIDGLDVSSQDSAAKALDSLKGSTGAINTVSAARADLGALQNRLEHTINNLDVAAENMSSANSRIRDTDMAKTMMEYTKQNVLTQAAQAMLAQANQQPQSVLQLLQ